MSGFPRSCHFLILFVFFWFRLRLVTFFLVAFPKTTGSRAVARLEKRCRKVPLGKASPAKVLSRKLWPTRQQKMANSVVKLQTCPHHPWDCYIYLHENHKNQPNVNIPYMDGMGCFFFSSRSLGDMIQFDEHIFQIGLKRQTRRKRRVTRFLLKGDGSIGVVYLKCFFLSDVV